jgi:hypothetical protein
MQACRSKRSRQARGAVPQQPAAGIRSGGSRLPLPRLPLWLARLFCSRNVTRSPTFVTDAEVSRPLSPVPHYGCGRAKKPNTAQTEFRREASRPRTALLQSGPLQLPQLQSDQHLAGVTVMPDGLTGTDKQRRSPAASRARSGPRAIAHGRWRVGCTAGFRCVCARWGSRKLLYQPRPSSLGRGGGRCRAGDAS